MLYAVTHFVSMLLSIVLIWLLTGIWSDATLADYFLFISILTFISTVLNFGLPTIYMKAIKLKNIEQINVIQLHQIGILFFGLLLVLLNFDNYAYIIYVTINSLLVFHQAEKRAKNDILGYSIAVILPLILSISYFLIQNDKSNLEGLFILSAFNLILLKKQLIMIFTLRKLKKEDLLRVYKEGLVLLSNNIQTTAETMIVRLGLKVTGNESLLIMLSIAQEYIQKITGVVLLYYKLILYPRLIDQMCIVKDVIMKQMFFVFVFIFTMLFVGFLLEDTELYSFVFRVEVELIPLFIVISINGLNLMKYLLLIDNVLFEKHKIVMQSQGSSLVLFTLLIMTGYFYNDGIVIATSSLISILGFIFTYYVYFRDFKKQAK